MKELITIDSIECDEIKANAKIYEKEILKFTEIVRKHIPIASTRDMLDIKKIFATQESDPVLRKDRMHTLVTKKRSTGYKINTKVDTNSYKVIWAFDLAGNGLESSTYFDFDEQRIEKALYFVYEQSEYLNNHEAVNSRFFSIYVAGLEYSEAGTVENYHICLARSNNNTQLTKSLNPKVAAKASVEIKRILNEYFLLKKINDEFNCVNAN